MSRDLSSLAPESHCPAEFSTTNFNQTHLNQLNKVFRIIWNLQAGVLKFGAKRCRVFVLYQQNRTPLTYSLFMCNFGKLLRYTSIFHLTLYYLWLQHNGYENQQFICQDLCARNNLHFKQKVFQPNIGKFAILRNWRGQRDGTVPNKTKESF